MPFLKMHENETEISASLVRELLAAQMPRWSHLALMPVPSAGTDNALFKLGDDLVVRLPRLPGSAGQIRKELEWLPRLAPLLPLAIPVPLAEGLPGEGYSFHWAVYRWMEGSDATQFGSLDPYQAALDLADFVDAMRKLDFDAPLPPGRGARLDARDSNTRQAIAALHGAVDTGRVFALWEEALRAPAWEEPPVWTHGDLIPTNLLVENGRISAVIDFGTLGVGDPACDLIGAWSVLTAETRQVFRDALDVDDAAWMRGRGWALSQALMIIPYYRQTNPVLVSVAERMIREIVD